MQSTPPLAEAGPFDRALGWLQAKMAAASGIILFVMMLLVVTNTLTRKFLNAPVAGAFEITQSLLTLAVFLSLAYTQRSGSHISVDVITRHLTGAMRRLSRMFGHLLGVACFAWATYANWGFAMQSYAMDEQEWGEITYPLWPVKLMICIGLGILTLQFVVELLREIRDMQRGES
jgi:TRAP-type mannitol/chloroaromatic compound transport system permease small subunit